MSKLREVLSEVNRVIGAENIQLALIGALDPTTSIPVIQAAGRPNNYVKIRILTGQEAGSETTARNTGVAPVYNTRVRIQRDVQFSNEWVVLEVDPAFISSNPTTSAANVPFHRHYIGSGLDDPVELRRFIPCRTWSSSGLTVNVDGFPYQWNGNNYSFLGISNYDISSHVPGGGLRRFVVVGVDPTTNQISIVDGPTYSSATPPLIANLLSIDFSGKISSAGVDLKNGQTVIVESNIYDLRPLVSAVGSGVVTSFNVTNPITNTGTAIAPNIGFSIKYNFSAITDPTPSDDSSTGYSRGSIWINTSSNLAYILVKSTVGSALWQPITVTGAIDIPFLNISAASDVNMTNASQYYDGVSVGLTPGVWYVSGNATVDNASLSTFSMKLWDGANVFSSAQSYSKISNFSPTAIINVAATTTYKISVSCDNTNSIISSTNNATQITAILLADIDAPTSGTPIGLLLALTKD